jgi:ER lumen protein retaining receptor
LWDFSLILESVCVLPQLMLLRQTDVPTVIDSMYLLTLGSYRALYILNWIERGATETGEPRPVPVIFGVIQTLFYIDFAWVYWTRQRVKLRNGAIVDSDDLSRGYLVSKLLGPGRDFTDEEGNDERRRGEGISAGPRAWAQRAAQTWGRRGISVSADEDLDDPASRPVPPAKNTDPSRPHEREGMLSNPDSFEDQDSDVDDVLPAPLPRGAGA